MKNNNKKDITKKISYYFVGLGFIAFGVTTMVLSHFGASPYDALIGYVSGLFGIQFSTAIYIIGGVFVFAAAAINKTRPSLLALLTTVLVGVLTYFMFKGLGPVIVKGDGLIELTGFTLGIVTISFGIALNVISNFAVSPFEIFPVAIIEKLGLSYVVGKGVVEAWLITLTLLLGLITYGFNIEALGLLGIGTLLFIILANPIIDLSLIFLKKVDSKI